MTLHWAGRMHTTLRGDGWGRLDRCGEKSWRNFKKEKQTEEGWKISCLGRSVGGSVQEVPSVFVQKKG